MALFGNNSGSKDERSSIVNAAKTFLANIRFLDVDNPVRTIAITSAVPNEGKTFVAANLGSAIATSGRTVLLVECDMRRRSMAHSLGVHAKNGIYAVLSGDIALADAAVSTNVPNLYFLDAEPHIPNPSDILSSGRFNKFIAYACTLYDYVVFDTPPVGTFVDAAVLGTKVDAVFMVVREGFTKKAEIVAAAEQLRKSGCNLAGVVMNYCERRDSEYYYEYYYSSSGHHDDNAPSLSTSAKGSLQDTSTELMGHQPVPKVPERRSASAASSLPQRPARKSAQTASASAAPSSAYAGSDTSSPSDTDVFLALAQMSRKDDVADQVSTGYTVPSVTVPRVDDEY